MQFTFGGGGPGGGAGAGGVTLNTGFGSSQSIPFTTNDPTSGV